MPFPRLGIVPFCRLGKQIIMKCHACDASAELRDFLHKFLSDKFKLGFSMSGVQCWPFLLIQGAPPPSTTHFFPAAMVVLNA